MLPLPIDPLLPDLLAHLRAQSSLVLVAEPGAGKTTRVPPAILRANILTPDHPNLIILQPRRVAARASALRIAQEQSWTLGQQVGYHVRFDKCLAPTTRLRVLTEGILTRQLLSDPFLESVGCVILDEFHERSLHCDLALAMLFEIQQTVRPDLKLLVMSATLDPEPISAFLNHAPIMRVPGRTFPIDIAYDTTPLMHNGHEAPVWQRAAQAVLRELSPPPAQVSEFSIQNSEFPNDILVFLPGVEEIRRTQHRLEEALSTQNSALRTSVIPLHGTLPPEDQLRALDPAPPGTRKIILATNIAETSLTIPGVTVVIDSGLARIAGYDPRRGLDRLELSRISNASATQRAGRAGRTAPGRCLRLWTPSQHRALKPFDTPEIQRVDLATTILTIHAWSGQNSNPRNFHWFQAPPEPAIAAAESLLQMLGALTPTSNESPLSLTPLGQSLLRLPIHPRLARLLLAAHDRNLAHDGATLAALLSEKDFAPPASHRPTVGPSDILEKIQLLNDLERSHFPQHFRDQGYDLHAARHLARTRTQLLQLTKQLPPPSPGIAIHGSTRPDAKTPQNKEALAPSSQHSELSTQHSPLLQLILYAYPDRVVKRRESGKNPTLGLMVGGSGVRLSPNSAVQLAPYYLALDARHDPRSPAQEALVQTASAIEESWLEELFPHEIRHDRQVEWNPSAQRVFPLDRIYYRDLILRESRHVPLDPVQAGAALQAALRPRAGEIFRTHPAAQEFLARLDLLRQALPEKPWPALSDADFADLLAPLCAGKKSLEEVTTPPTRLLQALESTLPYPLDRLLDELAPLTYTVPTGNNIKIQYPPTSLIATVPQSVSASPPVLAVRLQELFGLRETPRIAAGRVPLLLHLLAPNYRLVQITSDLQSFWQNAYFQVRKDLKARYPKHSWPEDPLTAPPQAKGRPRR